MAKKTQSKISQFLDRHTTKILAALALVIMVLGAVAGSFLLPGVGTVAGAFFGASFAATLIGTGIAAVNLIRLAKLDSKKSNTEEFNSGILFGSIVVGGLTVGLLMLCMGSFAAMPAFMLGLFASMSLSASLSVMFSSIGSSLAIDKTYAEETNLDLSQDQDEGTNEPLNGSHITMQNEFSNRDPMESMSEQPVITPLFTQSCSKLPDTQHTPNSPTLGF